MKRKPKQIEAVETQDWTPAKQELLEEQEGVIENGRAGFEKVATALVIIKTEGLYLKTHSNFKAYCQERWGFTGEWARRLLKVAEVDGILDEGNNVGSKVSKAGIEILKNSPVQARMELSGESKATIKKVTSEIGKIDSEKVTAKEVKAVVAKVTHVKVPVDDEELPAPEPRCPKCGKKKTGPTMDWVNGLVCNCDEEIKPLAVPAAKPVRLATSLDNHPVLVAYDNEWVNMKRALAYSSFTPVQIYERLRVAIEKELIK